jgi:small subunit ribosomal protein S6
MNIYENVVILNASLPDEEINASIAKISDLVVNSGGEVLKADQWGRKKLAYEINKQQKGFYVLFVFRTPAATIRKLEELYKVFDPVIKFMVIKLEPKQVRALEAAMAAEAERAEKAEKAKEEAEKAKEEA